MSELRDRSLAILVEDNPQSPAASLRYYAEVFVDYVEASRNIAQFGAIVFHPRSGTPIENPYLKVRDASRAKLNRIRIPSTDRLWDGTDFSPQPDPDQPQEPDTP